MKRCKAVWRPGANPLITPEMDEWLRQTILTWTQVKFGYDKNLWTCQILVKLLEQELGGSIAVSTVRLHLKNLGLIFQKPEYQDLKRDEQEIEHFSNDKFPSIQRCANKFWADIRSEDEAGLGIMRRHGRTLGLNGERHVVKVSMQKGEYKVLSTTTAHRDMTYFTKNYNVNWNDISSFDKKLFRIESVLLYYLWITLHFMALRSLERLCEHIGAN